MVKPAMVLSTNLVMRLISKGVKFQRKVIESNLFPDKNIYRDESNYSVPEEVNLISDISLENWTSDDHT
jgi:DNA-directed RNA polymerase subunit beta